MTRKTRDDVVRSATNLGGEQPEPAQAAAKEVKETALNPILQGFKLEQMNEVLGTQHLLKAARRLGENKKVNSRADAERQIRLTLNEPRSVDALIARLHPTELALLQETRRYGGVVSGWALYVYARLRGLNPPTQSMQVNSSYLFGHYSPANYTGSSMIWSLMADGLLFPASVPNPWLSQAGFYYRDTFELFPNAPQHLLIADPRLLNRLPHAPRPVAPALPAAQTSVPAPAPSALLSARLYLNEVLRVVGQHGGIIVTKSNEPSRTSMKRILKDLDALQEPEFWLGITMQLGLLIPDSKGENVVPYRTGWQQLSVLPPQQFMGVILNALPNLDTPEDQDHMMANPYTLRACLLELLKELRGPVRESDFKAQVEQVIPSELRGAKYQSYYYASQKANLNPWNPWLSKTLRGIMVDFGLLTVQEGKKPADAILIPNPLLRHDFTPPAPTSGPAWLLQPNFELLVYPDHLTEQHYPVLSAAQAVRFDAQTATYRLTRESVYTALENGLDLTALLDALERHSATPLAPAMRRTIQDWAARRERLVLHQHATLLEYPTQTERDTALKKGGTPVGDTFLLLEKGRGVPVGTTTLKYDTPPGKPLKFQDSGQFTLEGPLDLTARALLAGRVTPVGKGHYRFMPPHPEMPYPRTLLVDLEARASKRIPDLLRFQLSIWSGLTPQPNLARLTILQHPQAHTLAQHPTLKPLLGPTLSPTLLSIQEGQENAFQQALTQLGLTPQHELTRPTSTVTEELLVIPDTRKKRTFIEEAIQNGHNLLVHYHEEKETYSGWYGSRITQGRLRKDTLRPQSVDRSGSTPYLRAQLLESGEHVKIRIAYITGMALR